jgi:HK97 family phage major capsid protein
MDINKLKEKRAEINKELGAIVERSTGVMSAEDKERFAHLEKESGEIKETIERAERVSLERAELSKFNPVVPAATPVVGLSKKEAEAYSITRCVQRMLENKPIDGLEAEVSSEIARQSGVNPRGFYLPTKELNFGNRQISRAFDTTAGSKLVTQEWQGYIDALRNASILSQIGATYLGDLVGLVNIPVKSSTTSAYWVAEAGSPTASAPGVTTQRQLSPKTVGAYSDLTRSMIKQTSYDVENMIRQDLVTTVSLAIDSASINGTGTSNQPTGLLATLAAASVAATSLGTNGAALAWSNIVGYEQSVAAANASGPNMAYLTNASVRGKLKQTAKIGSTYPSWIWEADNSINGYKTAVSNAISSTGTKGTASNVCSTIIFGDFSNLVIGTWGALDLFLDPYSLSTNGGIRLVALQNVDVAVRQPTAFAYSTDVLTS